MKLDVTINGEMRTFNIAPKDTLLAVLRREGYFGVKHGCDDGTCGVCVVLLDGEAVLSCVMLAAQVAGKSLTTIEGLGTREALHPLQEAFVEIGAVQCGFCTPAQILAAQALLDEKGYGHTGSTSLPISEGEVCGGVGGVLCRCTGYAKPVQAVLMAAERMRAAAKGDA
ncbi:MAG: 2Fe-2S iron-sulfur cluster binding domain-containing protein [Anaerolineae bacterium]|nr:2Fe-2S iron-sulfur cluster binding domain-containing protein [Anaerolineae bacterium]